MKTHYISMLDDFESQKVKANVFFSIICLFLKQKIQ